MGLTVGDIAELTWYFAEPGADWVVAHALRAQTYDGGGAGGYDPYADDTLATLVQAGLARHTTQHARVTRVLHGLPSDMRLTLRLAFGPRDGAALPEKAFRYPGVAPYTPTALRRGRTLACDDARLDVGQRVYFAALASGCSPFVVAERVLRRLDDAPIPVTPDDAARAARRALERALRQANTETEFLCAVRSEMLELVAAAGEAYRARRRELGEGRRQEKARRKRASVELLERELGKRRAKERSRFELRLARGRTTGER